MEHHWAALAPFWLSADDRHVQWNSGGGGGGGKVFPYVCILGMCRARDPHFQPWISVPEHIIFTNYQKICSGASPFYIFWRILPFRRPIIFEISLISTRSSPPTAGSARMQSVRQRHGLAGCSGDSHFHAQNGSSSFRSPAFSRSKRLKLVLEPCIFTLDRELIPEPLPIFHFLSTRGTYLPKFGVEPLIKFLKPRSYYTGGINPCVTWIHAPVSYLWCHLGVSNVCLSIFEKLWIVTSS